MGELDGGDTFIQNIQRQTLILSEEIIKSFFKQGELSCMGGKGIPRLD